MNKQKWPLYIALAVPVLMIVLVAVFIYLPGVGQHPKYNFVYMSGSNIYSYSYGYQDYQVSGGKLVKNPPPPDLTPPGSPKSFYTPDSALPHFYFYDVGKNSAMEISFEQAEMYKLDSSNSSPDNYTIERGNGGGGDFIFGSSGGDYNSWFIKGHNRSVKLNLKLTGSTQYYSDNFRFLGWVE